MASAHFCQTVLIFFLGFQYILPYTESTTYFNTQNQADNNLKQFTSSLTIRDIIIKQAEVIPESDFEFSSKLIQIFDESNSKTDYFIKNKDDGLALVFTRNSNDLNDSIVVFKADDCERGFDPDLYFVLKVVQNQRIFNLKQKLYYVSVVYLRTDKQFPIEWDNWVPHSFKNVQKLESNPRTDPSQLQLLAEGIKIQFNYGYQCLQSSRRNSRIHKRGLFDSVIKSAGITTTFFENTMDAPFKARKPTTKKPKLVAVAKSKTLHEGNAVSNSMNRKSGVALSDSEAAGIGDAYASSGSYGKGGGEHKLAIASGSSGHGGAVKVTAHSDAHDPYPGDSRPESNSTPKNPGPAALLAETDQEFKDVLEYSSRVDKAVKRSIRTNSNENSPLIDPDFSYQLYKMDKEFLTRNNLIIPQLKKQSIPSVRKCDFCKSPEKSRRCESQNFLTFLLTHPKLLEKVKVQPSHEQDGPCSSKSLPIVENTLKIFNLECNPGTISFLERALLNRSLNHGEDGSLKISENLPILQKLKPSSVEIEELTALILISAFSSATRNLHYVTESENMKNDLFLRAITESLTITNSIANPHRIKVTRSISKVLQDLTLKIMFEIQHCKNFDLKKNPHSSKMFKGRLFNNFRILVTLERFVNLQSNVVMDFDMNYNIRDLFWKYYDLSSSIISQIIKYFITLH